MEKASFLVTDGIPGFAAKGEIIKVSDDGIHIGRWLPISKYSELMKSSDSLGPPSETQGFLPIRRPRASWSW
jgi:hypothetical protein